MPQPRLLVWLEVLLCERLNFTWYCIQKEMISLSAWLRLNSCLLVNFREHSSLPWTGPITDPLCPCSVGAGRQEEICTAQFGSADALAGFWDVLTRLAELPAQLLLKVLLAAKEAWGPAFTDPWSYRVWNVLPTHPTLIWKDFSFQTNSDTFRCSKNQILQTGGTLAASPNCTIFQPYPVNTPWDLADWVVCSGKRDSNTA